MTWQEIQGWFDFQLVYEQAVAEAQPGDVLVEVGCWLGRSTAYMGGLIKNAGKPLRFYAIDWGLGSGDTTKDKVTHQNTLASNHGVLTGALVANLRDCDVLDFVTPIVCRSTRGAELFADGSLHFAFIDAGHSYEQVTADIEAWWPKIRPGGILAGHDYEQGWPEVCRAVDDFFGSAWGVPGRHLACIPCNNSWSVRRTGDGSLPEPVQRSQ